LIKVLNASRHHRKNRSCPHASVITNSLCSTPRGITGKIAESKQVQSELKKVLNASRHHRKNRNVILLLLDHNDYVLNASRHHRKNRLDGIRIQKRD